MIRSFTGPLIMTFCLAMIVLILQFVWKWIDELVGKGLTWSVISELLMYVSAQLVPMALILSVLLASIMTFGNLGEHSELSALKSSGVSLTRIMTPLLFLVIILMAGAFLFSNYIVPKTNQKFFALMIDIRQQRPEFDIKEGQFVNDTRLEGYTIRIGKRSVKSKMLYDLMVYDHTSKAGNVSVTLADSGYMVMTKDKKNLVLTLYSGRSYAERLDDNKRIQKNKPLRRDHFEMQQFLFNLPGNELERTDEEIYKDNYKVKTMAGLSSYAKDLKKDLDYYRDKLANDLILSQYFRMDEKKKDSVPLTPRQDSLASLRINLDSLFRAMPLTRKKETVDYAMTLARSSQNLVSSTAERDQSKQRWIFRHLVEWHRKLTLSIACLIFFLIGAPLGAIIRKGGLGTPVVISTLFFIFYYIISLAGEKYARAGIFPVWFGMWGSTLFLFPLGIFLTIKSTRDSALMSGETYKLIIRKISGILRFVSRHKNENPPAY